MLGEEELAVGEWQEQIKLHDKRQLLEQAESLGNNEALEALRQRLSTKYAFANLAGLYTKTTVSELKIAAMADKDEAAFHTFEEKEIQPYIPAFRREEESVSGAVRGNAYHRVMELLDFEGTMGQAIVIPGGEKGGTFPENYAEFRQRLDEKRLAEYVHMFLEREAESRRLSREYMEAVNELRILHFLKSELAYRMWQAEERGNLYREQPFVMSVSASRLGTDFPESEKVLIQGIVDVFFEEEDGIVLLDYKTDSVASMQELWNRYETQLDYYSEALTKLMGKTVKEKILYSFHLETYDN